MRRALQIKDISRLQRIGFEDKQNIENNYRSNTTVLLNGFRRQNAFGSFCNSGTAEFNRLSNYADKQKRLFIAKRRCVRAYIHLYRCGADYPAV